MHVLPLKQKIVSTNTEKEIILVDILEQDKKKTKKFRNEIRTYQQD